MQEPVHTEVHNGYLIQIHYDTDPQNPREEFDHVGTMLCAHGRYKLGDQQFNGTDTMTAAQQIVAQIYDEFFPDDEMTAINYEEELLDKCPIIALPLYLYDHSGITMNTGGFHCPWDSGQVGLIYVSLEKAAKEWPQKMDETEENWKHRITEYLKGEVREYDHYLTGSVFRYQVFEPLVPNADPDDEDDWDEIDSCWGFYGDYSDENGCLEQARDCCPDKPKEFGDMFVMVFKPDGTVEFTRSPKLYAFFNGEGNMERISEIRKYHSGQEGYYIEWLKGPHLGMHTTTIDYKYGLLDQPDEGYVIKFSTYEAAVQHEVAVLNAMRKAGVTFS